MKILSPFGSTVLRSSHGGEPSIGGGVDYFQCGGFPSPRAGQQFPIVPQRTPSPPTVRDIHTR